MANGQQQDARCRGGVAVSDITCRRFIKPVAGGLEHCADGEIAIGVSKLDAVAGSAVSFDPSNGVKLVEADAAINDADPVTSAAAGRARVAVSTEAANGFAYGDSAGAAGEYVAVFLMHFIVP